MQEFIKVLKQINGLFDLGAEVSVSEENEIIIVGRDYAREYDGTTAEPGAVDGVLENQSACIERVYHADLTYADDYDDTKGYIDTLTPLLEIIERDNKRAATIRNL